MFGRILFASVLAGCVWAADGPGPLPTPRDLVSRVEARLTRVTDYECVMESEIRRGKKSTSGTYHIWFRRPELFRLKVLRGRHSGSQLVLTRGGDVRARPGGLLGRVIAQRMDRNNSRLRSPRGGYPWDASFDSLLAQLKRQLQQSDRSEVRAGKNPPGSLELEVEYREPGLEGRVRDVWLVDGRDGMILGRDSFENGVLAERMRFRDYRENPGIPERFFDL